MSPPAGLTIAATFSDEPLMPAWIAIPIAMAAIMVVAAHVASMYRASDMPPSRRRIRLANAWLMVITIPLLAFAVSIISPARQRTFVLVWSAAAGLVFLVLTVALIDMLNNHRLYTRSRLQLREQFERARREVADEMQRAATLSQGSNNAPSDAPRNHDQPQH